MILSATPLKHHFKNTVFIVSLILAFQSCKTKKQQVASVAPVVDTVVASIPQPKQYSPSETRINDIINTKLEVKFDWIKRHLMGKATLTVKPYFYPVKDLMLDARGFTINEVSLLKDNQKSKLEHVYDGSILTITLDKEYTREQTYQVFIDYTAKPDELESGGSEAITSDKGLYFINPEGKEKNKPRQIWTQGETQSNSTWFPTIDKPNERMTQEIFITVQKNYQTLSNGIMQAQFENADGTRTDHWVQSLPAAPYLTMMAIGEFSIVKEKWNGKLVDYYVEPAFEPHAKAIFGNTPEMLEFFSKKLGVEYPWEKYSQVVVRDYVSGAMENTSATLHGEFLQRTDRELLDNTNEDVISHELFHQWFGDLVTCESWANLPLNESFATYGEYIWNEYKYGRDAADHHNQQGLSAYLTEAKNKQVNMIRYDYDNREDMFDSHSYAKGGRILHMLRKHVGDDAFFAALKLYLTKHKYTSVEIHDLRLAFEEVTGEDLNWFFNQWFLSSGHPELHIETSFNDLTKNAKVTITQNQDFENTPLYRLPIAVDIYSAGKPERKMINVTKASEDFFFDQPTKPDLINVDAEKMLLAIKKENKSTSEWAYQYMNAPLFLDRYEAIDQLAKEGNNPDVLTVIKKALDDKFWSIRNMAIKNCRDLTGSSDKDIIRTKLINMARSDSKSTVRVSALIALSKYYEGDDLSALYRESLKDKAYSVVGQAITIISEKNKEEGYKLAKELENEKNGSILTTIANIYSTSGTDADNEFFIKASESIHGFEKYSFVQVYARYLMTRNDEIVNKGLPVLEEVARNENAWWLRLSGMQALSAIQSMYSDRELLLNDKITEKKKTEPASVAGLELEQNKVREQKQKILELINSIKKAETDKNLTRIYGN